MKQINAKPRQTIPLGHRGENEARQVIFDLADYISTYGPGTARLLHQRDGDPAPYIVPAAQSDTTLIWTVTDEDTAAPGKGSAELQWTVNDVLAKSDIWRTKTTVALDDGATAPPTGAEGWYQQLIAYIDSLRGEGVSEEQIAQAVTDYLTEHPIEETDPTVPAWAKQPEKPAYTAQEVGALPATTHIPSTAADVNAEPSGAVAQHNVSDAAHSDIRLLIQGLTDRLNALADSDDTTLDQLSEVVAYIKSNRSLIEAITTSKVSVADIVDDLTTNVSNKPLSAAQGVALKALINAIEVPSDDHINSLIDTKLGVIENGAY